MLNLKERVVRTPDGKAATIEPARRTVTQHLREALDMGPVGFVISIFLALVAWQLVVVIVGMEEFILPSPVAVGSEIWTFRSVLFEHGLVTLREILIGFGLALAVGIPLGTAISFSPLLKSLIYPLFISSNAIPKVALAPLLVIWFGFGGVTNALVAFSVAVFPVVINVSTGLQMIDEDMIKLGKVMDGSSWRIFRIIRVPVALPTWFAGFKLAMTNSTVGAVVGEFVASSAGLGYISQQAAGTLNTPLAFAALVVLSVLGIVLFVLVELVERLLVRW